MKVLLATIAVTAVLFAGNTYAADVPKLAGQSGCLTCHGIDKKLGDAPFFGPAYKDVAAKYKGNKAAEAKLVTKVKAGGSGVWGPGSMPPMSPQVKDDDIKTIVQWILAM